jgi:2-succinyl-5-enolpyruvyl-6-hydroxy-3-cyclohexene-1-carboxylate synthase
MDELFRGGVGLVVISPGSRSASLAIAATEHPNLETRVVLDERSAGFHALGRAKASGMPAAIVSTSGTAPTNYFPAVAEGDMSLTPLIVLSADRPQELRGVGANQTIDQVRLFGDRVRFFADIEAPDSDFDGNDAWRSTVSKAVAMSVGQGDRPGPVHLNVAFREPTVPVADDGRSRALEYPFTTEGRPGDLPWIDHALPDEESTDFELSPSARGLVIAGEGEYDRRRVLDAAVSMGWPILATAQSGLRGLDVVSTYHHILSAGIPTSLMPEVVLTIGSVGPSLRLENLVGSSIDLRIRVDRWGRHIDPSLNATEMLRANPALLLERRGPGKAPTDWTKAWSEAGRRVFSSTKEHLGQAPISGPVVASALNQVAWETLVVASSLPIRDVDAHLDRQGLVIANRGASGIDGFVSTSAGVASIASRTLAISGDLSLLHDSNGFLADSIDDLVIIVLDNNGGGLFDALPPAKHAPSYERLFVAPHDRDIEQLARFHDVAFAVAATPEAIIAEAEERLRSGGLHLIRVPIDREADVETRRMLDEVSRAEVARALGLNEP